MTGKVYAGLLVASCVAGAAIGYLSAAQPASTVPAARVGARPAVVAPVSQPVGKEPEPAGPDPLEDCRAQLEACRDLRAAPDDPQRQAPAP